MKIVSSGARHNAVLTGKHLRAYVPVMITESFGTRILILSASHVSKDDGQLFTWGWNKYGQVHNLSSNMKYRANGAQRLLLLTGSSSPSPHVQLGLGDTIDRNVPSRVSIDGCVTKNIACGWWHTLLLAEEP